MNNHTKSYNMDISMWIFYCFFIGICVLHKALTQDECTHEAIQQCTQPLHKYNLEDSAVFPQIYEAEMRTFCDEHEEAERCLNQFRQNCEKFQRHHFKGVAKAYDYICSSKGRKTYFKNWYCLDDKKMLRRVNRCNNTYQKDIKKTQREIHNHNFHDLNELRCDHINSYLSCIKDAISEECKDGDDIGEWHYEVHRRALKYVAHEINCDIGEPLLTPAEIAGIVIGGVVFIVIVVLLIYFCTCNVSRYRRKRTKISHERESEKSLKNGKPPSIVINAPEDESEYEDSEEEDSEIKIPVTSEAQENTYQSFRSETPVQNGQLSSRTRESLKLQLPVTPRSARRAPLYRSDDLDETQSEVSRSLPVLKNNAKRPRSRRGNARNSTKNSELDTDD